MEVNFETVHIVYILYAHIHHIHTQYSTHIDMKHTHYKDVNWLKFPVFGGCNVRIPCISTMAMLSYTICRYVHEAHTLHKHMKHTHVTHT